MKGWFVGELRNIKGEKLALIPLKSCQYELMIEEKSVIVSLMPSGREENDIPSLHMKFNKKVSKKEVFGKAIKDHHTKLNHLRQELVTCEKKLETKLKRLEIEHYVTTNIEKLSEEHKKIIENEVTELLFEKAQLVNRLTELEAITEIEVSIDVFGYTTAILSPGKATLVSFLPDPLFWIPYSLAREKVYNVEKQVYSVSLSSSLAIPSADYNTKFISANGHSQPQATKKIENLEKQVSSSSLDLSTFEIIDYKSAIIVDHPFKKKIESLFQERISSLEFLYDQEKGLNANIFECCIRNR
eukprot:Awhi_evm1s9590